jgi:hypothetical protein
MDKIDLVYILGEGSPWNNNELRYSLRSVGKNLPHGKIFIVGQQPRWLQNIEWIPVVDCCAIKQKNAVHKITAACNNEKVSENFILMNDDFFFLKPCEEIKNYRLGYLQKKMATHKTKLGRYYLAMKDTMDLLKSKGINYPLDFEPHYPCVINKEKFLKVFGGIHDQGQHGLLHRSVYFNLTKESGEPMERDLKVYTYDEFKYMKAREWSFFSTSDPVIRQRAMQEFLAGKFPTPSIYEKKEV